MVLVLKIVARPRIVRWVFALLLHSCRCLSRRNAELILDFASSNRSLSFHSLSGNTNLWVAWIFLLIAFLHLNRAICEIANDVNELPSNQECRKLTSIPSRLEKPQPFRYLRSTTGILAHQRCSVRIHVCHRYQHNRSSHKLRRPVHVFGD